MSDAIKKIEDILTTEYSATKYIEFMKEIFDSMEIVAPGKFNKEYSNFNSHIEGYVHIGNYNSPDNKKIAVFSVQLIKSSYVENARSTQRSYAKKLIESGNCDAAMIAFYTEGDSKWRLSFVRLDYEMKFEKGVFKTTENITPAKRYSFLVGKDEPCHTAIERFREFIINQNYNPTIDDIEEAFSVEKVTNEFFKLYCEKFYQLQEYLESNEEFKEEAERCGFTSEQFAKKLMGQIVFLYFLQKKGWLGVNVWTPTLTEKEYNNIYYSGTSSHKRIIQENLGKLYILQPDGAYKFSSRGFESMTEDIEEVIANHMPRKKTWGDGSKKFLRTIFNWSKSHDGQFYEDYLEPLFYNTLNRNRGEQAYCAQNLHCRIPFLSGGLFEPLDNYDWKNTHFNIPDEIFSNRKSENDRLADGILDIFDRYNFTISEDEPMEREVAIDPEMLGKIFENLLEIKDRKSKGAFYTPREIVHYMCQESLINYLVNKTRISTDAIRDFILYGDFMKDEDTTKSKREGNGGMYISDEIYKIDKTGTIVVNRLKDIDDALASVRVADPAVGSGAFPLGMMNEIVRARQNITAYMAIGMNPYDKRLLYLNDRSPYKLKYDTIKNCIYAADIEPSAVDIAQLRLWLSLVIDDEVNPEARNDLDGHKNPLPLPNLECNIVCGNSLIDQINGVKLADKSKLLNNIAAGDMLSMFSSSFDSIIEKLLKTQDELFRCDVTIKKEELKAKIQSYKDELIKKHLTDSQLTEKIPQIIADYENAISKTSKPFVVWEIDFARVFRDNGGFDIVIGNPPYIQLQKTIDEENGIKLGDLYQDLKMKTFAKTGDIYCLFYEKGYNLLRNNGVLSFITSNKWMRAGYGKQLREFFAKNTNPVLLIDFAGQKIFESATVDTNILMFEKTDNLKNTRTCIAKEDCRNNMSEYIQHNQTVMAFDSSESWVILSPIELSIKQKIESIGTPLKNWDINIYRGILTGFNEAFIISGEKKDELIAADPKSAEIIRPILRGRDIKRYSYTFADLWLIATFPSRQYNIDDYPAVRDYLLTFGIERLEQTGKSHKINGETVKSRKKTSNQWFETQDSISYWDDFSKQKIVWGNLCLFAQYALADEGYFINAPSPIITGGSKYMLAVMNSKVSDWFVRQLGVTRNGGYFEYKPMFVEQIPIPQVDVDTQTKFESIVDDIISLKDKNINTDNLEDKIDSMIYELFNFNKSEIEYIEKNS